MEPKSWPFVGFIVLQEGAVFTLHVKAILATFLTSPFKDKGYSKIALRTFPSVEAARDWAWANGYGIGT